MKIDEIISQIIFLGIAIFSLFIAYKFYESKNGRLRILLIELFIAKFWVYGGAATYYLLQNYGYIPHWPPVYIRYALNLPMLYVMFRLWNFIRIKYK